MAPESDGRSLLVGVGGIFLGLLLFAVGIVLHVQIGQLAPAHPEVGDAVMFIGLGVAIALPGWFLVARPLLATVREDSPRRRTE